MTYRVIQWATGLVGQEAIKGVLAHPDLELVGRWVHSPDKVGPRRRRALRHRPARRHGDRTTSTRSARSTPTASSTRRCWPARATVVRLLESGKNVVTPVGWIYPTAVTEASRRSRTRAAAATRRCTAPASIPGGITERFPLMLSALCRDIRHVRVEEFSDIRNYPTESVVREVMLFGTPPEQAATSPMPAILGDGFSQSIDMVAAALGWTLDAEKRTTHEMAVATRAARHAGRCDRRRAPSPRSASRGRGPSTASR